MRLRLVAAALVFLVVCAFGGAANSETAPLGLYQWRGYAEICLASEELGSGCSLAQTEDVYDTQQQCKIAVPLLLADATAHYVARDPTAWLSVQWACNEDRSVFNT